MSSTALQTGFTTETFEAFRGSRPSEPDWLRRRRQEAWEIFQAKAMPAMNEEQWRRVDIRGFKLDHYLPAPLISPTDGHALRAMVRQRSQFTAPGLQIDGREEEAQGLDQRLADQGVLFGPLEWFLDQHGDQIEPYLLTRCVDPGYDKFSALHAAFWSGGTLLYVPRGVVLDQPLYRLIGMAAPGVAELSHTLVVLEEGAQATLFEELASADETLPGLHVGAVEIFLGRGAQLRFVQLQNWGKEVWSFSHQRAILDAGASLQWGVGGLGSRLSKVNQEVVLAGAGAAAEMNGVMFTGDRQLHAYNTRQHHQAPSTRSDLLYKGALKDRSRIVWRGMIRVDPAAQKTDGYQRNDNLVLSRGARADSIPGLEIEADDVRCTHGATAGRVDDDQIFYATSRGLTRNEAVQMIVEGFFRSVYERIPVEAIGQVLHQAVARKTGAPAVMADE